MKRLRFIDRFGKASNMEIDFMDFEFEMFMGSSFGLEDDKKKKENMLNDAQIEQLLLFVNAQGFVTQDIINQIKMHTLELKK
mmetsp:Transcript_26961/g.41087  ORF Transcript_26961/g.41087 Transcript_26961/m.41087 type:complete len:82 (+) Transcript_26961:3003-3248(+)